MLLWYYPLENVSFFEVKEVYFFLFARSLIRVCYCRLSLVRRLSNSLRYSLQIVTANQLRFLQVSLKCIIVFFDFMPLIFLVYIYQYRPCIGRVRPFGYSDCGEMLCTLVEFSESKAHWSQTLINSDLIALWGTYHLQMTNWLIDTASSWTSETLKLDDGESQGKPTLETKVIL